MSADDPYGERQFALRVIVLLDDKPIGRYNIELRRITVPIASATLTRFDGSVTTQVPTCYICASENVVVTYLLRNAQPSEPVNLIAWSCCAEHRAQLEQDVKIVVDNIRMHPQIQVNPTDSRKLKITVYFPPEIAHGDIMRWIITTFAGKTKLPGSFA